MKQKNANKALIYICLLIGTVVVIFPFIWMLSTSLKTLKEVFVFPPQWIPEDPQWGNYAEVWKAKLFLHKMYFPTIIFSKKVFVARRIFAFLSVRSDLQSEHIEYQLCNAKRTSFLFLFV